MKRDFPDGDYLVTVGAARWNAPINSTPISLRESGPIIIMSGDSDKFNSDLNQSFVSQLKAHGADAHEIIYVGGHLLPDEPLRGVLKKEISR